MLNLMKNIYTACGVAINERWGSLKKGCPIFMYI